MTLLAPRWVNATDALPARYEPFGLSLVEAAQAGCALVLGDIRSLREVWGDTALFVPPDNCRMLAATVESLIRDRELRRQMASLARARAHTFSPERMAAGYIDAYAHASTSGARSAVGQAVQVQP